MAGTHVRLLHSERAPLPGARVIGPAHADEWIELTVKLRRRKPLPDVTQRPSEPLSRADLVRQYGADPADIDLVAKTLTPFGLTVVSTDAGSRTVRVAGRLDAIEKAFDVRLFLYEHERGNYRGRVGPIQVPAALDGIVTGVFGLDDRSVVRRRPTRPKLANPGRKRHPHRSWFYPGELAQIYKFPPGDGTGQTIGLIEFGGGYFPQDLTQFGQAAGIASLPRVVPVSVEGVATDARDGAEGEVMLDIEVVAGICPGATIPVYFSNFTEQGWVDVLDTVMQDTENAPSVLSISWGLAEDDPAWSQGALDAINEAFKEAALMGITVCVAAGDDGSDDQVGDGHAHVDFPASSPYVLAVGGTTLTVKAGVPSEKAWKDGDGLRKDGGGSTGGGVSALTTRPTWQNVEINSVNPGAIVGRVVPDVAADASANTGYFVVVDGNPGISGGTSAATPLWAALVARVNSSLGGKRAGFLAPVLYQAYAGGTVGAASCTDIQNGNNTTAAIGGYSAGPGYDAVTGWGTPVGTQLLTALKAVL